MPVFLQKIYQLKRFENQNKFNGFRKAYPFFEFQSYSFQVNGNNLEVDFSFNLSEKYFFNPRLTFIGSDKIHFKEVAPEALKSLVFHIGMVELISYWKAACPPKILLRPHRLDEYQVNWWKKLYFHGLGEFFFLNGIETDIDGFMQIESAGEELSGFQFVPDKNKVIVPVGGGKDSVVTLELLKDSGKEILPLMVNPRPASERTVKSAGLPRDNVIIVNRMLDPLLLELNDHGFLNGHTPFSALLAFIGVMSSVVSGTGTIALSNESSASQSTVPGTMINHQYSKSIEFEEDFTAYIARYIHPEIKYFSFLRPVNELQIARMFSNFPWHFDGFRSCNVGSKTDTWCGKCPKCLFTYVILSPFISQNRLVRIFGKNLLEETTLENFLDELTGKVAIKPFECIGTPDEVRSALWHLNRWLGESKKPYLLERFIRDFPPPQEETDFKMLLENFDRNHLPEPEYEEILKNALATAANGFRKFLKRKLQKHDQVLILGFGKEGRSSYHLIRALFPEKKLGIADRQEDIAPDEKILNDKDLQLYLGNRYLDAIDDYGLVFKSPGVKLKNSSFKNTEKVTSQTGLFLQYFRDRTIGVTGTKGKSTTATLINHILRQTGRKAVLLGNIGFPAFDTIDDINHDTIIVFELSAHQLEHARVSPHVAVLLNVYPEHLDHFNSFEQYHRAKTNIFRYQLPGDIIIIGADQTLDKSVSHIRTFGTQKNPDAVFSGDHVQFGDEQFLINPENVPLKGEHNVLNIMAAMLAVKEFGVGFGQAFSALKTFKGLPHRLEYVGNYGGIIFYNDSISTVPQSTMAAVKTIPGVDTLILGGFDRGLDYKELVEFLKTTGIRNFIFLGKAGEKMARLYRKPPVTKQSLFSCTSLAEAFGIIAKHTGKGAVCLLSPAAASYDQFHNFEHRGDAFRKLAKGC